MEYLFICEFGKKRSVKAAEIANEISRRNKLNINASYCGMGDLEDNLSSIKLDKYDRIIVMEDYMKEILNKKYKVRLSIIESLDILEFPGISLSLTTNSLIESKVREMLNLNEVLK